MHELRLFEFEVFNPVKYFLGVENSFFDLHMDTIVTTWGIILGIAVLLFIAKYYLAKEDSLVRFLLVYFIDAFKDLVTKTLGTFNYLHFVMITTFFLFIFACNSMSLIPWVEEPTKDLNTTLALGLLSFFYVQFYTMKSLGLKAYIKDFFSPFFLMFPLNVVGTLATIVSISFRLFGNIFGGAIIMELYEGSIGGNFLWEMLGILSGVNLTVTIFFGLFEGVIQAFVFAMLTLTYLAMGTQVEKEEA